MRGRIGYGRREFEFATRATEGYFGHGSDVPALRSDDDGLTATVAEIDMNRRIGTGAADDPNIYETPAGATQRAGSKSVEDVAQCRFAERRCLNTEIAIAKPVAQARVGDGEGLAEVAERKRHAGFVGRGAEDGIVVEVADHFGNDGALAAIGALFHLPRFCGAGPRVEGGRGCKLLQAGRI